MNAVKDDELANFFASADEEAEAYTRLVQFNAYQTGLVRGFFKGFGIAALIAVAVWLCWRFL
ncbi:MAG TPA: hypothetical protein VN666_21765 [Nitrospira sp.]|nr:hypothetical protein [Nitrospira sp.]